MIAPTTVAITSIVEKLDVNSRATTAGTTRAAAMRVTPSTFIVTRIEAASSSMRTASVTDTRTPDTSATSGSNVTNSSRR